MSVIAFLAARARERMSAVRESVMPPLWGHQLIQSRRERNSWRWHYHCERRGISPRRDGGRFYFILFYLPLIRLLLCRAPLKNLTKPLPARARASESHLFFSH